MILFLLPRDPGSSVGPPRFQRLPVDIHFSQRFPISLHARIGLGTVLKTLQMPHERSRSPRRQAVNHPCARAPTFHHPMLAQIGQMLGYFGLWEIQDFLQMTDTQGPAAEEMKNP